MYKVIIILAILFNLFLMFKYSKTTSFKILAVIFSTLFGYQVLVGEFPIDDAISCLSFMISAPIVVWIFSFVFQWVLLYLGWYFKPENVKKRTEKRNYELQQSMLREAERQKNLPKCKWCGVKHDSRGEFCSPKCSKEYSNNRR